ncbi:MAG: rhamnulokinase [Candidatus Hydrogenedentes bacterium]|nr:rhamnulokinase [Candidatus Hydrogenedentota bacterium]
MKDLYRFLAFDLGAESGRAVLGTLQGSKITLEEIHRFRTEGLVMLGRRQWDLARIYEEMITGMTKCAREHTADIDAIAIDTWGVDFGLLDSEGHVLANPVHYRDKRTEGMFEAAYAKVPKEEIYKATGIQFLPFNTSFQLLALVEANSPQLAAAKDLLLMGDLLAYLLCGKKACEYTNASTTQLLDPHTRTWNDDLIKRFGIPREILSDPVDPGTNLGFILPEIAERTGINPNTPVIAPGTHDTASAVVAVPATRDSGNWSYLSSGTWSLLGAELDEPCITDASMAQDFTNEGGVGGKIRFLKNIFGLWLVQECRRSWERQEGSKLDYSVITEEAAQSEAFRSIINLDDPRLFAPDDMPSLIQEICREVGQPIPETHGQIIRCALESLALKYRETLKALDDTLGRKTDTLHIIGGGTQNKLLNQMTADACGVRVVTGPVEATVLGNIGVQAMAVGALDSLDAVRKVIGDSVTLDTYTPQNTEKWAAFA